MPAHRIARFQVRPGQDSQALEVVRTFVGKIGESEPGTLRYESYQEVEQPARFLHVMEFADAAAEEVHEGTAHVKAFVDALHPLCETPPQLPAVRLVSAVGAQGLRVRSVHHVVDLPGPPGAAYDALMSAAKHAAFTGFAARIEQHVHGVFVTCGERNFGLNLELVPGRRIVQSWRHRDWPEGAYSIARFELEATPEGTRLDFTQLGVPTEAFGWIDGGWRSTYWEPLRRFLARP